MRNDKKSGILCKLDFHKFYIFAQFLGGFFGHDFLSFEKKFLSHLKIQFHQQKLPETRYGCKDRSNIVEVIVVSLGLGIKNKLKK